MTFRLESVKLYSRRVSMLDCFFYELADSLRHPCLLLIAEREPVGELSRPVNEEEEVRMGDAARLRNPLTCKAQAVKHAVYLGWRAGEQVEEGSLYIMGLGHSSKNLRGIMLGIKGDNKDSEVAALLVGDGLCRPFYLVDDQWAGFPAGGVNGRYQDNAALKLFRGD